MTVYVLTDSTGNPYAYGAVRGVYASREAAERARDQRIENERMVWGRTVLDDNYEIEDFEIES